jgi:hypothetical protein
MTGWKNWRDNLLIPDQHEPGVQKGFRGSAKTKKFMGSEHQSRANKGVKYWVNDKGQGTWAGGLTDRVQSGASR